MRTVEAWLYSQGSLRPLVKLSKDRTCKEALVLANGPSLSTLNVSRVLEKQSNGQLEIFTMNNFCTTTLGARITPNFYVLSDPQHHPDSNSNVSKQLWNYLAKAQGVTILIPRSWAIPEKFSRLSVAYFEDRSLEGITKNIDPRKARGYSSLTALKALALATFIGYSKIYVLGLDNSLFKGLQVTEENRILEKANHAPGGSTLQVADLTSEYPNGLADYFYGLAVATLQLKDLFRKAPIYNLSPNSFTDAFHKCDPLHLTLGDATSPSPTEQETP
jgi:hypothetical protein